MQIKYWNMLFTNRRNKRLDINRNAVVYSILCPLTDSIIYIGYTVNLKSRISYHINHWYEKNKKAAYIKSLKDIGLKPAFNILAEFDNVTDAKLFEEQKIKEIKPIYNTKI